PLPRHDMVVGDDQAVGRPDDARPGAAASVLDGDDTRPQALGDGRHRRPERCQPPLCAQTGHGLTPYRSPTVTVVSAIAPPRTTRTGCCVPALPGPSSAWSDCGSVVGCPPKAITISPNSSPPRSAGLSGSTPTISSPDSCVRPNWDRSAWGSATGCVAMPR